MSPAELEKVDIAEMNLLCAQGLPGAEKLDVRKCLSMLDQWALRVKGETERHLYRLTDPGYKDHAEHYKHSEARFRAEWLVTVLQKDVGVHYYKGFDPLSDKNCPIPDAERLETLAALKIDPERPLLLQVSRFDRFKDPLGVIEAYRLLKPYYHELQLVLAGGPADDDPEVAHRL